MNNNTEIKKFRCINNIGAEYFLVVGEVYEGYSETYEGSEYVRIFLADGEESFNPSRFIEVK